MSTDVLSGSDEDWLDADGTLPFGGLLSLVGGVPVATGLGTEPLDGAGSLVTVPVESVGGEWPGGEAGAHPSSIKLGTVHQLQRDMIGWV